MFMVRYLHKRRRYMTKEEFEKKLQESFGVNSYEELDFETLTKIVDRAIGAHGSYDDPMQEECVEMLEYILETDSKLPSKRKCSQQDKDGNSVLIAALRKIHATPLMCANLEEVVELFIKYNPDALYIKNRASESFVSEIFQDLGWEWSQMRWRLTFENIEDRDAGCFKAMTKILEHNPIRAWKAITSKRYHDKWWPNLPAMKALTELLCEDGKLKSLNQSDKEALDSCIKNAYLKHDTINKEKDRSQ